jgi:hypothetical protein
MFQANDSDYGRPRVSNPQGPAANNDQQNLLARPQQVQQQQQGQGHQQPQQQPQQHQQQQQRQADNEAGPINPFELDNEAELGGGHSLKDRMASLCANDILADVHFTVGTSEGAMAAGAAVIVPPIGGVRTIPAHKVNSMIRRTPNG